MARSSLLAVLAGLALAVTAAAAPAAAHDSLLSSDPADGAHLAEPPGAVVLEFSGEILELNPALELSHAQVPVELGEAQVSGRTVTWEVLDPQGLPAGEYGVVWAVTSEDGHPIDGTFSFEVDAAWSPVVEETTEPEPSESAEPSEAAEPSAEEPEAETEQPGSGETLVPVGDESLEKAKDGSDLTDVSGMAEMWFFAGLAVTVLLVVGIVLAIRRSRDPNGPPGQH